MYGTQIFADGTDVHGFIGDDLIGCQSPERAILL